MVAAPGGNGIPCGRTEGSVPSILHGGLAARRRLQAFPATNTVHCRLNVASRAIGSPPYVRRNENRTLKGDVNSRVWHISEVLRPTATRKRRRRSSMQPSSELRLQTSQPWKPVTLRSNEKKLHLSHTIQQQAYSSHVQQSCPSSTACDCCLFSRIRLGVTCPGHVISDAFPLGGIIHIIPPSVSQKTTGNSIQCCQLSNFVPRSGDFWTVQ